MTYQITQEQLSEIIRLSYDAGVRTEQTGNEPDECYENLMFDIFGEDFYELDGCYDFEHSTDYYLYVCCNIMTPDFKEFIDEKKQELNELLLSYTIKK